MNAIIYFVSHHIGFSIILVILLYWLLKNSPGFAMWLAGICSALFIAAWLFQAVNNQVYQSLRKIETPIQYVETLTRDALNKAMTLFKNSNANEKIINHGCDGIGMSLECNIIKEVASSVQSTGSDIDAAKSMCPSLPIVRKLIPEENEKFAFCNPDSATFKDTKGILDAIKSAIARVLAKKFVPFYSADPNVLQSYDDCLQKAVGTDQQKKDTGCYDFPTRQKWRICMEISLQAFSYAAGSSESEPLLLCRKAH